MTQTKEEILQKEYSSRVMNWEKAYRRETSLIESAHAAMDQYAKQKCIAFAEWMVRRNGHYLGDGKWRVGHLLTKTTEELYTLYLQTSSK
jgi:hypothetical protein